MRWLSGFGWPVQPAADREAEFVYRGQSDSLCRALLMHEDRKQLVAGSWTAIRRALSDCSPRSRNSKRPVIRGFYALALAPPLYNVLFRLYSQIQYLRHLCTRGICKAPIVGGHALFDAFEMEHSAHEPFHGFH